MNDDSTATGPEPQDQPQPPLDLYPAWRQAVESAHQEFTYGDIIPMDWLERHFDLPEPQTIAAFRRHQFDLLRAMDRFRETMLTKYKMAIRNRRGYGYEIIRPPAQTEFGMMELRRDIARSLGKCHRILTHVNDRLLDIDDARHNAEQRAKLAALASLSRKTIDEPSRLESKEDDA